MALTVAKAFEEFQEDSVNLNTDRTRLARRSRDWLVEEQLRMFPQRDALFPRLYSEKDISYGSFARKTKARPLSDIDIMLCFSADGCYYTDNGYGDQITITTVETAPNLRRLTHQDGITLSPVRLINRIISNLSDVPQYENADVHRDGVAATLKLSSYEWNFDIVPCFHTVREYDGRDYYLIPTTTGYWQKTDPRKDRDKVNNVNQFHNGNFLNVARIAKFWNNFAVMPTMQSYFLESMLLHYYGNRPGKAGQYVDLEFIEVLTHITNNIFLPVPDPKEIQGDLNTPKYNKLTIEQKRNIQNKSSSDLAKAREARRYEENNDHETAIKMWGEIFGPQFPNYGQ